MNRKRTIIITRLTLVFVTLLSTGCAVMFNPIISASSDNGGTGGTGSGSCTGATIEVAAAHSNAPDWNNYLNTQAGSEGVHDGVNNVACVAATDTNCFHGGQVRKVDLSPLTSCDGLSAVDDLGVFQWKCYDDTGSAIFYSIALIPGKGLADLVNESGWLNNKVTISGTNCTSETASSNTWWGNSVYDLSDVAYVNDGGGDPPIALNDPGGIYYLPANQGTTGYNLDADGISVVMPDDVIMTSVGTADNCNQGTGEIAAADRPVTLCTGSNHYSWIEGNYDRGSSPGTEARVLYYANSNYNHVRNATIVNSIYGIRFTAGSSYNHVEWSRITNITTYGLVFWPGIGSKANDIVCSNSGSCILAGNTNDISMVRVISHNNNESTNFFDNTDVNMVATTFANDFRSVWLYDNAGKPIQTRFHNMIVSNSLESVELVSTQRSTFSNIGIVQNGTPSIDHTVNSVDDHFTGYLFLGPGDTCDSAGTNPGVDTNCDPINGSDHTKNPGGSTRDFSDTFYNMAARVEAPGDNTNTSDTNGTVAFAASIDWYFFDTFWRSWGLDGSAFPNADSHGPCGAADTCRIWDFRPDLGDTQIYNRSGDAQNPNSLFDNGSNCIAELDGNVTTTDEGGQVFLSNATENFFDALGDDDGLCESNEACIYTPHIGGYQGSGNPYSQSCIFNDGTITGVTIYAFPNLD